jgi:hypothetical protein
MAGPALMPAKCQRKRQGRAARAARTYLQEQADGSDITLDDMVERFGV